MHLNPHESRQTASDSAGEHGPPNPYESPATSGQLPEVTVPPYPVKANYFFLACILVFAIVIFARSTDLRAAFLGVVIVTVVCSPLPFFFAFLATVCTIPTRMKLFQYRFHRGLRLALLLWGAMVLMAAAGEARMLF